MATTMTDLLDLSEELLEIALRDDASPGVKNAILGLRKKLNALSRDLPKEQSELQVMMDLFRQQGEMIDQISQAGIEQIQQLTATGQRLGTADSRE